MKPTPIQFEYDDAKLEAITVCEERKKDEKTAGQTDVTKELEAYMEVLYKKYVPVQVRDFIEKKEELTPKEAPKPQRRNVSPRRPVSDEKPDEGADTHESE